MAEKKNYNNIRRTGMSQTFFISQTDKYSVGKGGATFKFLLQINDDLKIYLRDQDAIFKLIAALNNVVDGRIGPMDNSSPEGESESF